MWAFGSLAPAAFWARRQAHETMVHRADAELAAGRPVVLDPELAADAIDEWLTIMAGPRYGRPDARQAALPDSASLCVSAIAPDQRGTGSGQWLISNAGGGVVVEGMAGDAVRAGRDTPGPGAPGPDLTVSGPPDQLLLVLLRRIPAAAAAMTVTGDATLLTGWLAGTPF